MAEDLNGRLAQARSDQSALNDLVEQYLPFIKREVGKYPSLGIDYEDRLSIGMLVFMNCALQYEPDKGGFFAFASVSIRNRLIDEGKKQARIQSKLISFESGQGLEETDAYVQQASYQVYSRQMERTLLAEEIELLGVQLAGFGISMDDLDKVSPSHKRTRRQCVVLARTAAQSAEMIHSVLNFKRLPIAKLCEATGVSQRSIEKYRRYIVALTLILSGDYPAIRALIPIEEEGLP